MEFDYEIPVEEYAAAQVLFYKAYAKGQFVKRALGWVSIGVILIVAALLRWAPEWAPILLVLTGIFFVYVGVASLFPARHYLRAYRESGLAGKKYHAEVDANGFAVSGDGCSWGVP